MMLVRLKDISRLYQMGSKQIAALNCVNLEVEHGEFIAVMGPSGSGKSTLLNIIGCLHKPTSGSYLLENLNVGTLTDKQLARIRNRKIGFVFQSFNLFPQLSALKNVEIPLVYNGCPKTERSKKAHEVLAVVSLTDRVTHKPSELSGGQQQRVAIARALVTRPSLLLPDEPTGNLDSASGKEIMELFTHLNRRGMTIIMVTHQERIARYAKRIITLKDGEIVCDGPDY